MNKKKLSVVMAGAMLASSVAPVLAATEKHEVHLDNRGILISELRNLLAKKFADVQQNKELAGKPVYEIKVGNEVVETTEALESAIKSAGADTKVVVTDKGHQEVNGKFYHRTQVAVEGTTSTWTQAELKAVAKEFKDHADRYPSILSMELNETETALKVVSRQAKDDKTYVEYLCEVGGTQLNFKAPLDINGKVIDAATGSANEWDSIVKYDTKVDGALAVGSVIGSKVVAEITLTDVDAKHEVALTDLYDGLLLTAKGEELLAAVKKHNIDLSSTYIDNNGNGIFEFGMQFNVNGKKILVSVKSNDNKRITTFRNILRNKKAPVQILAGDNRYETAVKVAKENASIEDVSRNGNIVLVNGNALVDGLAAAPLAASVWNKGNDIELEMNDNHVAPILLTEANSIPTATKKYMKELVAKQLVGKLDKVTVYLVGGEAVISPAVEKELKEIGFRVVRAGGDNREETSLRVAEVMRKDTKDAKFDNAFVVGAEGEADAMSIASVAAQKKQPIIVSKKGGLSNNAINYLAGGKKDNSSMKATIIGGEVAVSAETEKALKDEKVVTERVAGENRKATNAAVMNKYYTNGFHQIVLSKDGQANKSHLVDALTATSLAVKHNAPIVLATDKLAKVQLNALELAANRDLYASNSGFYVYQVGNGVSVDILRTIAERLGLAYK